MKRAELLAIIDEDGTVLMDGTWRLCIYSLARREEAVHKFNYIKSRPNTKNVRLVKLVEAYED
jgi:hypothetical protein